MIRYYMFLVILLGGCATQLVTPLVPSDVDKCEIIPDFVEEYIATYTENMRGAEYCEFRDIARGDINSDGVEDLVVIFNIEGACGEDRSMTPGACGNKHTTYLKVFLGEDNTEIPILVIGSRGYRIIGNPIVINGKIQIETTEYGRNDPMCCPSIKGKTELALVKNELVEKRP